MSYELDRQIIKETAEQTTKQGYRFFIAESGTYGFITDGQKVVSVGIEYFAPTFSGNYVTDNPRQCGQGWRLEYSGAFNCAELLAQNAPRWATQGAKWRYKTLTEYLAQYQASSRFLEYEGDNNANI